MSLLLTRRRHQQIRIGEHIVITVHQLFRRQVVLGIDAPKEIAIDRAEIRAKKINGTPSSEREIDNPPIKTLSGEGNLLWRCHARFGNLVQRQNWVLQKRTRSIPATLKEAESSKPIPPSSEE